MKLTEALKNSPNVRRRSWPSGSFLRYTGEYFEVPGTEQKRTTVPVEWIMCSDWENVEAT